MKPNAPLEDRLASLGSALRRRPGLTDRVMVDVRRSAADVSPGDPVDVRLASGEIGCTVDAVRPRAAFPSEGRPDGREATTR